MKIRWPSVGANLRKEGTCEPLVKVVSMRLASWRNRFVSLRGRVVMLNLIMNFIHFFFLSFIFEDVG